MSEDRILKAIANKVQDDRLHYQIIIQDDAVHIYINRDTEDYIDYRELTKNIQSAVQALDELDLIEMGLYSRILGEVEPDWQTFVELTQGNNIPEENLESIADEISSTAKSTDDLIAKIDREFETTDEEIKPESLGNQQSVDLGESESSDISEIKQESEEAISDIEHSINLSKSEPPESTTEIIPKKVSGDRDSIDLSQDETAELDLSQYCFIRNKRLLNADLVVPQEKIAQIVNTFHNFDESIKRSQLPILYSYFKDGQDPDTDDFAPEIQTWWAEIKELESNTKRKLAIWLSRYCLDVVTTIATIKTVFEAKAETAKEKARQEREAHNTSNKDCSFDRSELEQYESSTQSTTKRSTLDLTIPVCFILGILCFLIIGKLMSLEKITSFPTMCEDNEDRDYCHLAVQIMGEKKLQESIKVASKLSPESFEFALQDCQKKANIAAGITRDVAHSHDSPPLYLDIANIFPGVRVIDVEQVNVNNKDKTVRTICILEEKSGRRVNNLVRIKQINPAWPEMVYNSSDYENSRSYKRSLKRILIRILKYLSISLFTVPVVYRKKSNSSK